MNRVESSNSLFSLLICDDDAGELPSCPILVVLRQGTRAKMLFMPSSRFGQVNLSLSVG